MDEIKKEATEYGAGSNNLEGNKPQYTELKEILETLDGTDDSFLLKVVEYINKDKKEEDTNVKAKK